MIALEIPGDSLRPKVVLGSQVENLVNEFRRDLTWVTSGDGLLAEQPCLSARKIGLPPPVECRARNTKVPADLGVVSSALGIIQNHEPPMSFEGITYLLLHFQTSFRTRRLIHSQTSFRAASFSNQSVSEGLTTLQSLKVFMNMGTEDALQLNSRTHRKSEKSS